MFIDDLRKQILGSEFANDNTYAHGDYISKLICPECGHPEAWAYAKKPFSIICNRQNECGARTKTIPLFNIYERIERKYQPTKKDPHRPARVYLESRGIPTAIINQIEFEYHPKTRKGCDGGVVFPVGKDDKGATLYNGRLFNPPQGEGKAHNKGQVSGHHWEMPDYDYDPEQPTYVTEGMLDALSFIAMGLQAIAILGAGYDPARFDLSKFGNLVFSFDHDSAGTKFTRKWLTHFQDMQTKKNCSTKVSAIMPTEGDWNDLLCNAGTTEKAKERFNKNRDRYQTQADLALAETAQIYAEIYAKDNKRVVPGLFPFEGCYYWSWIKDAEEIKTMWVSNFTVSVKHFQRSDSDKELPVFQYRLKIMPKKGQPISATATGDNLKSPDGLTGFFLRHGKALWQGSTEAAKAFAEMIVNSKAPVVRQAEFMGFDHRSGFHVLKDIAISPMGKIIYPEKNGFFKLKHGEHLRPALIETIRPGKCDFLRIYRLLISTWGNNAATALSFLTASLFVNSIKPRTKFFPFLSMYGDPQTGKSRLLTTLNAMQCLDEEGIPMNKANTLKGELRALAQVSGHMKGFLESNKPEKHRFEFDTILSLYNHGNPLQVRAQTTNDNRLNKIPFHGTIAFVQNNEPFKTRAQKERVISLKFSTDDLNDHTKTAFDSLMTVPLSELAGFLPAVMEYRPFIEKSWEHRFKQARGDLKKAIPDNRINENHALILTFHRMLKERFNLGDDLQPFFEKIGKAKMESCKQRTQTPADFFFDALNELPDTIKGSGEHGEYTSPKSAFCEIIENNLFINRTRAEQAIRATGMILDYPERLGSSLQIHPAFLRSGVNHRFTGIKDKPVKAMVFDIMRMND
ncbi:MAG: toprim domain-containing protein [Desulfobacterales bacterium]|nr:toprim domain-containing protein [Desulfobacterales bacterium]